MKSFIDRAQAWTDLQHACAEEWVRRIRSDEFDVVRFMWPDQHGLLRGKTITASAACDVLYGGVNLTSTLLGKDTSHKTVFPVFSQACPDTPFPLQGASDFTIVADPTTFRVLPWARRTAWVLCDAYSADGLPSPFGTRGLLKKALDDLAAKKLRFVAGLEVECHIFKLDDPNLRLSDSGQPGTPPDVLALNHGYQYLTELRYDAAEPILDRLRAAIQELGLPLTSIEIEFGPSQFELVFGPEEGLIAADNMVILRNAVKQVCQRHGYHATFMCRPRIPNVMSSGWHLHQSLRSSTDGRNVFVPDQPDQALSPLGQHYLAGLMQHAPAASAFACPTINGYRRYRPHSLAPDRANWARDNRGALLRVLGGMGQAATRIENRAGEPAANPYLYFAAQIFSGLDGIERRLDPGPSADQPYETPAVPLPRSLADAIVLLRQSPLFQQKMGERFLEYFCYIKTEEIARFNLQVSDWEQREYFEMF